MRIFAQACFEHLIYCIQIGILQWVRWDLKTGHPDSVQHSKHYFKRRIAKKIEVVLFTPKRKTLSLENTHQLKGPEKDDIWITLEPGMSLP